MIKKLTKEQEDLIPVYREKFRAYGLSTERCDRKRAEAAVLAVEKEFGRGDQTIYWFDGPNQLFDFVEREAGRDALQQFNWSFSSNLDAYWASTYCFINEVLPVKKTELADLLHDVVKNVGLYWVAEEQIFMVDRPIEIHFNDRGVLDKQGGPAVLYSDGTAVYMIDGVRVTGKDVDNYVMKNANEIDLKAVLNIKNVDLRRAVLKKVGPANLLKNLKAKHLDSVELEVPIDQIIEGLIQTGMYGKEDRAAIIKHLNTVQTRRLYDLYEIDFGDFKARYLRMVNPSIDEEHVEGVTIECKTVEDALRFRDNKTKDSPAYSAILS